MSPKRSAHPKTRHPWPPFVRRHARNPLLDLDPLYALPGPLIDRIDSAAPRFWTAADKAFEQDLAQTSSGGFCYHQPIPCPFLPPPPNAVQQHHAQALQALGEEELKSQGYSDLRIRKLQEAEQTRQAEAELRGLAYTGWLVTNSQFCAERDQVRAVWEPAVAAVGRFPALRLSVLGERGDPVSADEAELFIFYRRWGLRSFLTWDLPLPIRPQFFQILYADTLTLGSAGLLLFLPGHLLRDEHFTLKDLARHLQMIQGPDHLSGWLNKPGSAARKLGHTRLKNLLIVFWCWTLVLTRRYGARLAGSTAHLDQALAGYLGLSTDSVKKLRLQRPT